MPDASSSRSLRRWSIVGALAIATIALLAMARQRVVAARWAAAVALADAQQARLATRTPARLRTIGADPVNAWHHYLAALQALAAKPPAEETALARLRRATAAATGGVPIPFERGFAADLPGVGPLLGLGELAAGRAAERAKAGDLEAALDLLIDGMQFAIDLLESGIAVEEMVGARTLSALLETATGLASAVPRAAALAPRLAAALADADPAIHPTSESVRVDAVLLVRSIDDLDGLFGGSITARLWRYAFSARIAIAAHVHDALALADEFDAVLANPTLPLRQIEELTRRRRSSPNPITRLCAHDLTETTRERLRVIQRLRLLRTALGARLGTPSLSLRDPLGGSFGLEVLEDRVRASSADGESLELPLALAEAAGHRPR